jgi:hypothetical protein
MNSAWSRTVVATAMVAFSASAAQAADCDRACLGGMIAKYVEAIVAHNPKMLPLAPTVRFTEDSRELPLGDGVWKTVTRAGTFRQDYLDVRRGIAASHVELHEEAAQIQYSVILRVVDQKITGIETLVNRVTKESRFQPDSSLAKPLRKMNDPVPGGKRMSREDLIKVALTYPEGLRIGSFPDATPFAKDAYRVENGMFIAGEGCPRATCPGMYTQRVILHPGIVASVAAVDEELGLVLLWMNFGYTNSYGANNALVTFEAFKIWGGEIQAINAFFRIMPLETPRFWPSAK